MKFKRVEIQAFRAYKDVKDGTFDFMTKSNELADFVSIYAPNGFGKTSFYDAVEWGYTKNISRFLRRDKDNLNAAKAEGDSCITRNKFSGGLETFVRLYTTKQEEPIIRIRENKRKNSRDLGFKESDTIPGTEYFRDVLLSQEWIDAFLKEDDATVRYEKFIKSFGDIDLDNKYKIITELIKLNANNIKDLDNQLGGIQLELNIEFDHDILVKVNTEIDLLNNQGEKLPTIHSNFTEKDLLNLSNQISERTTDLESEKLNLQDKIKRIDTIVTGNNENSVGAEEYFKSKNEINTIDKKLTELNWIKKQFQQQQENNNIKANKKQELKELIQKQTFLIDLAKIYPKYDEIKREIEKIEINVDGLNKEINKISIDTLEPLIRIQNETKIKLEAENKNHQRFFLRLSKIPKQSKELNEKRTEYKNLSNQIESAKISKSKKEKEIITDKSEIVEWKELISQFSKNNYLNSENKKLESYKDEIKALLNGIIEIKCTKENLSKIEKDINNADTLNKEITDFITKGANIITQHELFECPLCKNKYESFSVLAKRISTNTFLSEKIQKLLDERTQEEHKLNLLLKTQENESNKLLNKLTEIVTDLQDKLISKQIELNEIIKTIDKYNDNINRINNDTAELIKEIGSENIDEITTALTQEITSVVILVEELKKQLDKNNIDRQTIEEKIAIIKSQIASFKNKEEDFKKNDSYLKILDYAKTKQIKAEAVLATFSQQQTEIKSKITEANNIILNASETLTALSKQLEKFDSTKNLLDIDTATRKKELLEKTCNTFAYLVKSELDLKLTDDHTSNNISNFIANKKNIYIVSLLKKEEIIKSLHKVK